MPAKKLTDRFLQTVRVSEKDRQVTYFDTLETGLSLFVRCWFWGNQGVSGRCLHRRLCQKQDGGRGGEEQDGRAEDQKASFGQARKTKQKQRQKASGHCRPRSAGRLLAGKRIRRRATHTPPHGNTHKRQKTHFVSKSKRSSSRQESSPTLLKSTSPQRPMVVWQ